MKGVTRDAVVAAARVLASFTIWPNWYRMGHLSHAAFRRLRDVFPEAAIVDHAHPDSISAFSTFAISVDGFLIEAQTYSPECSNDGLEVRKA